MLAKEVMDGMKNEDMPATINLAVNYTDPYEERTYTVSASFRVTRQMAEILSYNLESGGSAGS